MTKHSKPGASNSEKNGSDTRSSRELLDELSSIQSLLGDGAADVDPHNLGEGDDIPTLPPVETHADDDIGDAHAQIPLIGAESADARTATATRAPKPPPAERVNPFLPQQRSAPEPAAKTANEALEELIAQRSANTVKAATKAASVSTPTVKPLNDGQIRALVDETLAEWMPKIERDLRNRLIDSLKNNH